MSSPAAKQSHPDSTQLKDVVPPIVEALGSCTHSLFLMLAIQTATQEGSLLEGRAVKGTGRKKVTAGKGCDFCWICNEIIPKHHVSETKYYRPLTHITATCRGNIHTHDENWHRCFSRVEQGTTCTSDLLETHCLFLMIQSL